MPEPEISDSSASAVEFRGVEYSVSDGSLTRQILRGIDLNISPGETLALLGRSGSGKTTILKLINGLLFPTKGEVLVEERPTRSWNPVGLKRQTGYVLQEGGLFPHLTVEGNVGIVPKLQGWSPERIVARTEEVLTLVGLDPAEFRTRLPRQLSGGQRQRVGVARAIAAEPALLLLDEPFGALDPVTRFDLQQQFLQLSRTLELTAVFVTHDIREALMLGTRVALLRNGCIDVLASPRDFLNSRSDEARAFLRSLEWSPAHT